jgi:hypothetical protein
MALYSKEYDIFLGGTPHAHSKYAIQEQDMSSVEGLQDEGE